MRRFAVISITALVAACATPLYQDANVIDADNDARMSVRLVEVRSDSAVIRPAYEIVIGQGARSVTFNRNVVWDQPVLPSVPVGTSPAPALYRESAVAPTSSLPAKVADKSMAVEKSVFLTEAHFEFGSAHLTPQAKALLDASLAEIKSMSPRRISIVGHTDSIGADVTNQRLSERRADAVYEYLKGKGLKVGNVERVGFGKRAPAAANSTEEGRAQNRRAEVMATVSHQ